MKRAIKILAIAALSGFLACTAKEQEPDEELKALDAKITQMESQLNDFRERMKTAESDRGLRDQMTEDEALLKSRLERLRERARQKRPVQASGAQEPL